VLTGFLALRWWQIPLAVAGIMLAISGPSMTLAWFKLGSRNLGPILDANGWAINARARINIPFGTSLTQLAQLPANSERSLSDPFRGEVFGPEAGTPWPPSRCWCCWRSGRWGCRRSGISPEAVPRKVEEAPGDEDPVNNRDAGVRA
jgi:hypothetical protein